MTWEEGRATSGPLCVTSPLLFLSRSLDLTGPLLLGGVPDLPESFPVRTRHFVGCMRNLQVDSQHVDMANFIANNGTVPGMGACGWSKARSHLQKRRGHLLRDICMQGVEAPFSHCHRTPA